MFAIIWPASWLVCAARSVPTASTRSGTFAGCTDNTDTLLTVSGAALAVSRSLEQPTRVARASNRRPAVTTDASFIRFLCFAVEIRFMD